MYVPSSFCCLGSFLFVSTNSKLKLAPPFPPIRSGNPPSFNLSAFSPSSSRILLATDPLPVDIPNRSRGYGAGFASPPPLSLLPVVVIPPSWAADPFPLSKTAPRCSNPGKHALIYWLVSFFTTRASWAASFWLSATPLPFNTSLKIPFLSQSRYEEAPSSFGRKTPRVWRTYEPVPHAPLVPLSFPKPLLSSFEKRNCWQRPDLVPLLFNPLFFPSPP